MPLLPLDLSAVLQLVFTALFVVVAAVWMMKRTASKLFSVDSGFENMGTGGVRVGDENQCATCGKAGTKKCTGCKRVRYCSQSCQSKHWKSDHQYSCKHMKSSNEAQNSSSGSGGFGRRNSSRFGAISLVPAGGPCKTFKVPKKILFPYNEFVKLFNSENTGFPPCGLINCGNSCYANVVLQCLSCTRPLIAYLFERDHSRECVRKIDDWCFLCELQAHVQRAKESSMPFSPVNFLAQLRNIGGNLGYGRQEDAHEFMRFAIDTMQSICLDEFGGEKAIDPITQETTLVQYIFGGHLRSQVTCTKCNMTSDRYENMMDLTVEIDGDAESLEQCLDQFTSKEWLDGDNKYKCDGCNDYVKAWKRLTVHQAPNILTIALKRFQSGRFGKLNKRVSFPLTLDLSPYMSGGSDGTDIYTLYAVVVHVDMLNASFFGHYICYTKDNNGQWYRIDDCEVTTADVEDVLSEGAYMLLYSRKSARKEPFVYQGKPQIIKQPTEVILKETDNTHVASPTSVSCFPTSEDVGLTDTEVFQLRDIEHDSEFSDDLDYEKANHKVMDVLTYDHPRNDVPGGLEDVSSTKPAQENVLEEVSNYASSAHGDISLLDSMQVDVHPEISMCEGYTNEDHANDAEIQVEGDQVNIIEEETSTVSTSVLYGTNTYHNATNTPLESSSISRNGTENRSVECSDKSTSELETLKLSAEACDLLRSAMEIDSVVGKAASQKQNGSSGKPKVAFSRGFLNKKTSHNVTKNQSGSNSVIYTSRSNGNCNGHADQDSVDKPKMSSQNGKDANYNDMSFMSRGFLTKAYLSSSGNKTSERRLDDQCEINGVAPLNNLDLRPQTDCSHGASLIGTSYQLNLRSTLANGIGNGICKKDRQLEMLSNSNGDDNLLEPEKPQPGYSNGHNGLMEVEAENGARHNDSSVQ